MVNGNIQQYLGAALRQFYRDLAECEPYAILLEGMDETTPSQSNSAQNRWAFIGLGKRQALTLKGNYLTVGEQAVEVLDAEALFEHLRKVTARCRLYADQCPERVPFSGGLMGYLSYEFGRWCDPALAPVLEHAAHRAPLPELVLCECETWVIIDRRTGEAWILSDDAARKQALKDQWQRTWSEARQQDGWPESDGVDVAAYVQGFEPSLSPNRFCEAVDTIKSAIVAGEVYQANLTLQLKKRMSLSPAEVLDIYDDLSRRNPSPFAGLFQWPGGRILSNSPERLVHVGGDRRAQVRPIAGTRGRGQNEEEDQRIGEILLNNEKERAEHLMLVDLGRNDLGRICEAGTVEVDEVLVLERYSHVTHLVSNITGQLKPGCDAWDVLAATFPGGTITGCPKIRCMERLQALEPVSRGPYTGGLGYIDAGRGHMDFNILIRSLFLQETETPFVYNGAIHVGAGIVADSVGEYEYRECLRKAAAILGVLQNREQSRCQPVQ